MKSGNIQPQLDLSEHISLETTGDNINAKRVAIYVWNGSAWERMTQPSGSSSQAYITQFYNDDTYEYICKATPGTSLSSSNWQVFRLDSIGNKRYADGNANFDNVATDLTTVQGYSYT